MCCMVLGYGNTHSKYGKTYCALEWMLKSEMFRVNHHYLGEALVEED